MATVLLPDSVIDDGSELFFSVRWNQVIDVLALGNDNLETRTSGQRVPEPLGQFLNLQSGLVREAKGARRFVKMNVQSADVANFNLEDGLRWIRAKPDEVTEGDL